MGRPVVLVVDDEGPNVVTFARVFRRELEVRTAASADGALAVLEHERIDVLLTDYAMPSMNGLELARVVAERWPHVQRLATTGHFDLPELVEAERVGLVCKVIPKPWRKADLLAVIERVCRGTPDAVA
jgi:DNA-binding NtrC family response regulator